MLILRASPFVAEPTARLLSTPCNISLSYPVICSTCSSLIFPPAQCSPPSALSSLSLYLLHYPTPLFLHPLAPSLPFSFPLCTLERLALIKLIAMVIPSNGFHSRQHLPAAAAATPLQRDGKGQSNMKAGSFLNHSLSGLTAAGVFTLE